MIQMTIQVPDKLAMRCQAAGPWLPTLMELEKKLDALPRYRTILQE